jgi:hypothetical protein
MIQLSVWNALSAQSPLGSLGSRPYGKNAWIWPCRTSSSVPNVAVLRQAAALPKRPMRASPIEARYSGMVIAP